MESKKKILPLIQFARTKGNVTFLIKVNSYIIYKNTYGVNSDIFLKNMCSDA